MYPNNNHDFHKLDIQQQVSLDKHQEMLRNALAWRQLPEAEGVEEKPIIVQRLQVAWTTLMHVLMGH
jgi:hypothetical protein